MPKMPLTRDRALLLAELLDEFSDDAETPYFVGLEATTMAETVRRIVHDRHVAEITPPAPTWDAAAVYDEFKERRRGGRAMRIPAEFDPHHCHAPYPGTHPGDGRVA